MTDSVTYVYGIMRNPDPNVVEGLEGITGSQVRLVRSGELAAIVSSVDAEEFGEEALRKNLEDLQWLERIARGHNQVVAGLAARASVAPLGLATIYFNDDRVRATLAEQADVFVEVLDRISGRAEWGVKAYADLNNPALQAKPATDLEDQETPGAAYLRELRERRESRVNAEQMALELAGEVHAELAALAHASRVHPPQNRQLAAYEGLMVLNCSYLVDDTAADEFASAVRSAADKRPALKVELTGPWPPYSFAVLPDEEQR